MKMGSKLSGKGLHILSWDSRIKLTTSLCTATEAYSTELKKKSQFKRILTHGGHLADWVASFPRGEHSQPATPSLLPPQTYVRVNNSCFDILPHSEVR